MSTIRQRGDKWQAIVRIKKGGVIVHQESSTHETKRLAEDWADRVEKKVRAVGAPQRRLEVETLGGLVLKYHEALVGVKPLRRSVEHELGNLSREFNSVKLSTVTSETFTRYALARAKAGAGPATVMHNLATVRTVLNAAKPMFGLEIDGGLVREAVAALSRMGVVARSRSVVRRTQPDELEKLDKEFRRMQGYPSTIIPMHIIVLLAIALPRRRSELMGALWEDYNREAGTLVLRDTKNPKAPRTEVVPVPPKAAEIINALPVIDARILPYEPESVSSSFERTCKRLGIEHLRFHDLRHEGISRLFESGLDIPEVALISGHLDWATLRRYTHMHVDHVLQKLRRYAHLQPAQVLEKLGAKPVRSAGADRRRGFDDGIRFAPAESNASHEYLDGYAEGVARFKAETGTKG